MATHAEITPVDDTTFEREVMNAEVPVLIDVSTEWCGPCKALLPHVAAVAREFGARLRVVALDADRSPRAAARLGVRAFPTLVVIKGGREVARQVGAVPKSRVVALLEEHL